MVQADTLRLDSYNPAAQEIVSRKFTQFSDILQSTGIGYVNEIPAKMARGDSWIFKPDGNVRMRKEYFNPYKLETANTTTDVNGNYSAFPEFGEYDDLIRKDR